MTQDLRTYLDVLLARYPDSTFATQARAAVVGAPLDGVSLSGGEPFAQAAACCAAWLKTEAGGNVHA